MSHFPKHYFILLITLLSLTALLALFADTPGYLFIQFHGWELESTLATMLVALTLLLTSLILIFKVVSSIFTLPSRLIAWRQQQKRRRAESETNHGIRMLLQGYWQQAERQLTRYADQSPVPLINYLGAARAAQKLGQNDQRNHYLSLAVKSTPGSDLAVGLTQAELQLAGEQYEHALATLKGLQQRDPQHPYLIYLLYHIYRKLNEWDELLALTSKLHLSPLLQNLDLDQLITEIQIARLQLSAKKPEQLTSIWNGLSPKLQQQIELLCVYIKLLLEQDNIEMAYILAEAYLNKHWSTQIIRLYGKMICKEPLKQLQQVEKWLSEYGENPDLHLTLGRISKKAQLWGKARDYLEKSMQLRPDPETALELAQLLEQTGDPKIAHSIYKNGLILAVGSSVSSISIHQ